MCQPIICHNFCRKLHENENEKNCNKVGLACGTKLKRNCLPQRSCDQGNIFTRVCLSTGGCLPHCMVGYTPPRQTPPREADNPQKQTPPPEADIPRSRHPPGGRHPPQSRHPQRQTPPLADTPTGRHLLDRHPPTHADTPLARHPLGRHPNTWQTPPTLGRHPPLGRDPLGRHPPPPWQTNTAADGTDPT